MNKSGTLILIFLGILTLSACQKQLEINYPKIKPALTVSCLFTPDSTFTLKVGKLLSINDTVSSFLVEDALCEIRENGNITEQLEYTENGFYKTTSLTAKPGNIYELTVSHPDFNTVTAVDTMPEPATVTETYFVHNTLYDALDEAYFHTINIRFQDNAKAENYYELRLVLEQKYDEELHTDNLLLTKTGDLTLLNTGLIDYQPASIPFSDKFFNGQNYFLSTYYKLPFMSGDFTYNSHNIIVHFNTVSYQYYQHARQMILHLRNQESDIFEGIGDPVQMYSNIENGYGIFAAYCPYIDTLHHVHDWNNNP